MPRKPTNTIEDNDKINALEIINGTSPNFESVEMPRFAGSWKTGNVVLDNSTWKLEAAASALELADNLSNISHILNV